MGSCLFLCSLLDGRPDFLGLAQTRRRGDAYVSAYVRTCARECIYECECVCECVCAYVGIFCARVSRNHQPLVLQLLVSRRVLHVTACVRGIRGSSIWYNLYTYNCITVTRGSFRWHCDHTPLGLIHQLDTPVYKHSLTRQFCG